MLNGHRSNFIEPRVQSLAAIPFYCEQDGMKSLKVPDNAPVLRRRKYTRQQRKSLVIEPDIGLILAGAGPQSSSSEDDKGTEENVPMERRKYGAKRRMKKRFYSTSNLKTADADGADESTIGTKSLSVRDLNGDNIDFNNRDSVKKWTSQMFAELESIPSSRRGSMDVTRSVHIPPEVQIDFQPLEQPPSPTKRKRFPVFEIDEVPLPPMPRLQPEVVGPNFLRDLLNASCSQYPESNCSDRLATSDTNTATQKASRASSFEWLNNSEEYCKANEVGKYDDCSSDEADREVALIGMEKDAVKSKKHFEELERSVAELESLGNSTWFPPPPPIPDERRDYSFDSLPTTFRKRKTAEKQRHAIGSIYENAALSDLLKLRGKDKKIPSIQAMSIRIDKPFSLENLPMVQRLSEFNKPSDEKQVGKKSSTFPDFALQLAERDAVDACTWLRKAGFSKYADQFDEGQLPIGPVSAKDHGILEADLRSLNRRISILNRCHAMKVDSVPMRRRMNNDYARIDPKSDDNSSGYSENWRYGGHHSQTWTRPSASDHVYSGSLARIPTSKPTWQSHSMAEPSRPIDSRKVQRTDWYEAQSTRGRVNDIPDNASTTACVNELNSAKLQRSQSERIKDRARAIMKKMDLRNTNKRPKDPRSRPAPPMAIGDPVLVSYDTPKNSIRSHHIDRPSILPERGRQLYQSPPFQAQSRSKSIAQNRRAGLVFMTPTSPDSGNNSFVYSDVTPSLASSRSTIHGDRRREQSMPPPSRHRVNMNAPSFPLPFPDGTMRRRELMPFDSYLYPGNLHDRKYDEPMPERVYDGHDHDQVKPTMDAKKTTDPNNISMFNDGYYTHEIKTTLPRHNGNSNGIRNLNGNGLLIKPENLKVNTEKIEALSSSEEPNGKTTLTRRSDSGLGSSLSRSPSGPYTQRIRQSLLPYPTATFSGNSSAFSCCSWSSSNKQNEMYGSMRSNSIVDEPFFTDIELSRSIDSLNLIEMTKLRKTSYLKLTSILERSVEGRVSLVDPDQDELPSKNTWSVQRLIKRMKITDVKMNKENDDSVFGVGLDIVYNRTGYFLPRPILEVMNFLRNVAPETIGIFRKNGVKSRIAELRAIIDSQSFPSSDVFVGENSLDSTQVHDVADLLKQYLRDLPEPLMTVKMSEVFANICSSVPDVERLTALQYAIVLLPDENREALKTLLFFLKDVSRSSQVNNMTAQNLSVCFTPSLFQLSASRLDKVAPGSRRHKTVGGTGLPTEKEMKEAKACQTCLTMLIEYAQTVFMVPDCVDEHSEAEDDIPNLTDLGLKGPRSFLVDRVIDMIRDHSDSWKSWTLEGSYRGIEISSKKPSDSHPLKTFRVWADVPAAPKSIMMRILKERHLWDNAVINWRHVEYVSAPDTDIHQYVINETIGHPTKDCHVARFHSSGLTEIRGACAIAERSVKCAEDHLLGGVSATIFDQRFLIEPISGGQSRVNYFARVDLKGRSLQWYNKSFGSGMCRHVERLRESFSLHDKNGPETNV